MDERVEVDAMRMKTKCRQPGRHFTIDGDQDEQEDDVCLAETVSCDLIEENDETSTSQTRTLTHTHTNS